MQEKLITVCCECGKEINLDEATLTEDTGEPICNDCKNL